MSGEQEHQNQEERQKLEQMEKNVGRTVTFTDDDGTRHYGQISAVSNSEHYTVLLERNWPWPWMVRAEAIHFVEDIRKKI